jgi:hypothetical protein
MTHYRTSNQTLSSISAAARVAKAERQAVLERVRVQRAQASKKSVAEWMKTGGIIRGTDLKERYENRSR